MSKKKAEGDDKKGGSKKKIPAMVAVVAVVFIAGGKVMGGKAAPAAPGVTTTTQPGPVVALDPITLNLADGRLLKVGVAFQMSADHASAGGGGGHGAAPAKDDPTKGYARALDLVIEVFGHRTFEQLVEPEGREAAKKLLVKELKHAYHGEIEGVYFHQFVMQ